VSLPASLTYILPPIVGAGIGLFTNWLAIKMLFRPLAERRLFGLRVPFTPGILPRERQRIASSLGDTVAIDLLDEKTIATRLRSPAFKDAIAKAATDFGRKALETRPVDIVSAIDRGVLESLRPVLVAVLGSLASSQAFSGAVIEGTGAAIEEAHDIPLSNLADPELIGGLANALNRPEGASRVADTLADAIMSALERAAKDGKRLASFIDPETLNSITSKVVTSGYPALGDAVDGFLSDKAMVASMEKAGARIIRKTLDRFNSVQRFFIGLGQYDKAIIENMPATIADFSEAVGAIMREPSTKKALIDRVSQTLTKAADKPLSSFAFLSDPDSGVEARVSLSAVLRDAFLAIEPASLDAIIPALLSRHTLGDVLDTFPDLATGLGTALSRLSAMLVRPAPHDEAGSAGTALGRAFLASFSHAFFERTRSLPLGETLNIDDEALDIVASAVATALSELTVSESANMLESIDIRSLVVEKIESLDMIEVERMILRVVDKELGAITVFGGILGAIIGMFQSLLFFLR
jgi:hypothetical protein